VTFLCSDCEVPRNPNRGPPGGIAGTSGGIAAEFCGCHRALPAHCNPAAFHAASNQVIVHAIRQMIASCAAHCERSNLDQDTKPIVVYDGRRDRRCWGTGIAEVNAWPAAASACGAEACTDAASRRQRPQSTVATGQGVALENIPFGRFETSSFEMGHQGRMAGAGTIRRRLYNGGGWAALQFRRLRAAASDRLASPSFTDGSVHVVTWATRNPDDSR
jgi:hypothetical protein